MLGLRYVACEECGRVTATPVADGDQSGACGRCESDAVRDLDTDDATDEGVTYFASSMRAE